MNQIIVVLVAVLLGAIGQIVLKRGMNQVKVVGTREVVHNLFKVFTNMFIIGGLCSYVLSSILWLYSMTRFDISFMYPLISLSYLITTIFAIIFLKEKVHSKRWLGLTLIIVGSFLIMAGG